MIYTIVMIRHAQRDLRLIAAANQAITEHVANAAPGANEARIRLTTQLELHTMLYTEYRYTCLPTIRRSGTQPLHRRNAYFAVINLIGGDVFNFVEDFHHQRDGVIEAEVAMIDDMIERIRDTTT